MAIGIAIPFTPPGGLSRLHGAAAAVLAAPGALDVVLRGPVAARQNMAPAKEMDLTEILAIVCRAQKQRSRCSQQPCADLGKDRSIPVLFGVGIASPHTEPLKLMVFTVVSPRA